MIPVILLYALSASSFTVGKAVLAYTEPFFFLAVRMLFVGSCLLGYSAWQRKWRIEWASNSRDIALFFLMSVVHIFLAFSFELIALQNMASYKAALLYNISPFITAFFSYIYFAEMLSAKKIIGLTIGFLGFLIEVAGTAPQENIKAIGFISWSEVAMFMSVVATAYGWIIMRMMVKRGYSPLVVNGFAMIGGGFMSLAASWLSVSWSPLPVTSWQWFIILTAIIAFLNDMLFYNFYAYLLKKYTATFLSFAGFLLPIIAALFGWIFLHETITWRFVFSTMLVSVGLTLFHLEELKEGKSVKEL